MDQTSQSRDLALSPPLELPIDHGPPGRGATKTGLGQEDQGQEEYAFQRGDGPQNWKGGGSNERTADGSLFHNTQPVTHTTLTYTSVMVPKTADTLGATHSSARRDCIMSLSAAIRADRSRSPRDARYCLGGLVTTTSLQFRSILNGKRASPSTGHRTTRLAFCRSRWTASSCPTSAWHGAPGSHLTPAIR